MRIGVVGLGKLGLPVALAIEAAGHEVTGWDISPDVHRILDDRHLPYLERDAQALLEETQIRLAEPDELAAWADLVLVAVQTPHQPEFEGVTSLTDERADFDYGWLTAAVDSVRDARLVVVVSTVLPGTMERKVLPLVPKDRLLYNPSFIAMGTTIPDFRKPEFVLVGTDGAYPGPLRDMYAKIHGRPLFVTTVKTAELTKVAYNTFIGLKIVWGNAIMELCEKTGADSDDVVDALSLATDRIISPAYMRGGMGDGGGCHPRDLIALSWLAREVDLSYDLFEATMVAREAQTEWLSDLAQDALVHDIVSGAGGRITLLGKAYKPGTNLTVGSPATLLGNILAENGVEFTHEDPYVEGGAA